MGEREKEARAAGSVVTLSLEEAPGLERVLWVNLECDLMAIGSLKLNDIPFLAVEVGMLASACTRSS